MIKRKRVVPETTKLNLVPIMDAVFIFLFFLLLSAQFVKIFEIETEAPLVREVPSNQKMSEEPLNLRLKITRSKVEVLTGIDGNISKSFNRSDKNMLDKMKKHLLSLRLSHPDDDYVIVSPDPAIEYKQIIEIIDGAQKLPEGRRTIELKNGTEKTVINKIFSQVILEPLGES